MTNILCEARHFEDGRWHSCILLAHEDGEHECLCGSWSDTPVTIATQPANELPK